MIYGFERDESIFILRPMMANKAKHFITKQFPVLAGWHAAQQMRNPTYVKGFAGNFVEFYCYLMGLIHSIKEIFALFCRREVLFW